MDPVAHLADDSAVATTLTKQRQRAHALIAKASPERVRALFDALGAVPGAIAVRPSDIGLVMVRGRMGGSGAAFNLGELPVARAAVRLPDGATGIGYVAGRNRDHAELAALGDAMVQSPGWRDRIEVEVLAPLEAEAAHRAIEVARKAAATRVDFFTLVRTRAEP